VAILVGTEPEIGWNAETYYQNEPKVPVPSLKWDPGRVEFGWVGRVGRFGESKFAWWDGLLMQLMGLTKENPGGKVAITNPVGPDSPGEVTGFPGVAQLEWAFSGA
jgi:hypothetical protein